MVAAEITGVRTDEQWRAILRLLPGYDCFRFPADSGLWFDREAADKAVQFFGHPEVGCLRHIEGDMAGKLFHLEPWQEAFVGALFGWKRADGTRRYREALIYVPRKNGKTPLCAGIAAYVLFCDPEAGQQDYIAASEREQAAMLFRFMRGMVEREPELKSRCRIYGGNAAAGQPKSIVREDTGSFVRVLSREADSVHGGNSHLVIIDELHTQPDRSMVDVLQTSQASANRKNPLFITITTADFYRESICNEKYDYACKVRDGVLDDSAFLPVIYEAGQDDDWTLETTWEKANPNLDISVSREYLRRECQRAMETPSYEATFKRLHLNLRTNAETVWIPAEAWHTCSGLMPLESSQQWRQDCEERFRGAECYAGLDLSGSKDITALALVFLDSDDRMTVLPYFWVPEDGIQQRSHKDRVNYTAWIGQAFIETTPGPIVQYSFVRERINKIGQCHRIKSLGIDPWNAPQLATELTHDGLKVEFYRQGFASMNIPSKDLERRIVAGQIVHGGNPVLKWMNDNAMAESDAAGNIKPSKRKSTGRIDGIVATVMAIGMTLAEPPMSIYETAGALGL